MKDDQQGTTQKRNERQLFQLFFMTDKVNRKKGYSKQASQKQDPKQLFQRQAPTPRKHQQSIASSEIGLTIAKAYSAYDER